jgi:4-hydroxy-3-methylbut-2-enyl diphosphate reductase
MPSAVDLEHHNILTWWGELSMKINLAKSAGFCFGVKRALKIALKTAGTGSAVEMLGDIVHNEEVVLGIQEAGIKKVKKLKEGAGKILLIRAHGASEDIYRKAKKLGYTIVDATCPMVKEIHTIVKASKKEGCRIIVIGDKHHDEVRGIMGQLRNKALVIDTIEQIPLATIKRIKKACVVVQSTHNAEKILSIVAILRKHIKEVQFFNTICRPTRIKQKEAKSMPLKNDVMIIIGSKTSANTKRLYQISKALNRRSYWIRSSAEVESEWFKGAHTVGIMAGASTPDDTTNDVIARIRSL